MRWVAIFGVPLAAAVLGAWLQLNLNKHMIEDLRAGQEQLILLHLKE